MSKWLVTFGNDRDRIGWVSTNPMTNQEIAARENRTIDQINIRKSSDIKMASFRSYYHYLKDELHDYLEGKYQFGWVGPMESSYYLIIDQPTEFIAKWKLTDSLVLKTIKIDDIPKYRRLILNDYELYDSKPEHIKTYTDFVKHYDVVKLHKSGRYQVDMNSTGNRHVLSCDHIWSLQPDDFEFIKDDRYNLYFNTTINETRTILSLFVTDSRFDEIKSRFTNAIELV